MTVAVPVARLARPARTRSIANDVLTGLPLALVAAAVGWRLGGVSAAVAAALLTIGGVAVVAAVHVRRLNRDWLIRRLDARRAEMEDSADLLFAAEPSLSPLQRLQRERLERRLDAAASSALQSGWAIRRIATAWTLGILVAAAIVLVPAPQRATALAPSDDGVPAAPGVPILIGQRLRVVPPAYTGLPARDATALDVRAPQGARLEWTLRFAPQPASAALVLVDGTRVPLTRSGEVWTARRTLDRSALYRVVPIVPAGQPLPRLHRLDAVADAAPQIRVIVPDRSLSVVTPGQRSWPLSFEASDDYGVAPTAQLHLTIAEGEGENVKFRESVVTLTGTGSGRVRRFTAQPDLAALKFVVGSDLIAQLTVSDKRAGGPQSVRSPSLILRWPSDLGEAAGMEGVVTRALPAYFTSQRQIIIDAEALLKTRPRPAPDRFLARADGIGADQRLLRLRYGQFLGEEQEGENATPPTADAAVATPPVDEETGKVAKPAFGNEGDALADYGHVHDESEAATLLDPGTRKTLKAALDAMWQSELNLRQGAPQAALPFAYTALKLIKQVQQSTRIFLAKVGPELPSIDEARRLTGKREGLERRELVPTPMITPDVTPATAWRALAGRTDPTQLAAIEGWLRANPAATSDPLAFTAAIDAVRREPGCAACRETLRGLLWSALPRPAPGVVRRDTGDATGRRYLDAIPR